MEVLILPNTKKFSVARHLRCTLNTRSRNARAKARSRFQCLAMRAFRRIAWRPKYCLNSAKPAPSDLSESEIDP